jgi:hypothetical protein
MTEHDRLQSLTAAPPEDVDDDEEPFDEFDPVGKLPLRPEVGSGDGSPL